MILLGVSWHKLLSLPSLGHVAAGHAQAGIRDLDPPALLGLVQSVNREGETPYTRLTQRDK